MLLRDYQDAAKRTINGSLTPDQVMLDAAAGLAEEAGEVLGLVRKQLFQQRPMERARLAEELGDALWCLTTLAGAAGIELEEVAQGNIEKLRRRYPDGLGAERREG